MPAVRKLSLFTFWLITSALYGLTIVVAELSMTPCGSLRSFVTLVAKWAVLSLSASGIIGLICLNRLVFAILWPIIYVVSAVAAYFVVSIGASISPGLVDLAAANGFSMWSTLISAKLVAVIIISLILSVLVMAVRWRRVDSTKKGRIIISAISLAILVLALFSSTSLKTAVKARLPFSIYYSLKGYFNNRVEIAEVRDTYDDTPVVCPYDAPDVYLVIGESLRADHLPQNGYERNTMPLTASDSMMVSYRNVKSDSWFTHASVPLIMTDTDSLNREDAYFNQSFISLFKRAGYLTAWFANQDLSPSYTYFAHEADSLIYCNSLMTVYSYADYLDRDILPLLARWRDKSADRRRLAVIHTIGSHWWYKSHYPECDANFLPEIDSHDVASMTREQMVNSYDNTILETDRFLSSLTAMLDGTNSVVVYISDHGENLGEDGMYLHTEARDATLSPACLIWCSREFAERYPALLARIRDNADRPANTDAIFHTLLQLAGLQTPVFKPHKSLLYDDTESF